MRAFLTGRAEGSEARGVSIYTIGDGLIHVSQMGPGRRLRSRAVSSERRTVYYVEFFRKRDDVSWAEFRGMIERAYKKWAEIHPEDAPVLAIGRTWRLAPHELAYLIVWRIDHLSRIDEWTSVRRSDPASAAAIEQGTLSVSDMNAGVYDHTGFELL